jgi:arylsulfatase A-like enzyme
MHFQPYKPKGHKAIARFIIYLFLSVRLTVTPSQGFTQDLPNIILIYSDDVGYGDISANGATKIHTPNIDDLARTGLRFTNAYATASTCTPSRFSLLTGKYAWRQPGTGIAPGNASLLIPLTTMTLPAILRKAGYTTGVIGKWHLGLGSENGPDWNGVIVPGPLEIGFDYSFIFPATLDRVPCVFIENHAVVGLNKNDPITVDYRHPVGDGPTGLSNPELLTMKPSFGHNQSIINGISRIGYVGGGKSAWWDDQLVGDLLVKKAIAFIRANASGHFFLYFAVHGIHVPRVPNPRYAGLSGLGPRGDAILEMDDMVGRVRHTVDSLGLSGRTMIIFTSDNGPVLDDGYQDKAVELLHGHTPSGPFRGGKYSAFDAGTRVPFIVQWPGRIDSAGVTDARFSQIDLFASLAKLAGIRNPKGQAMDSRNLLDALLGKSHRGRRYIVQQSVDNALSIVAGDWKYISPNPGPAVDRNTGIQLGNSTLPQLYNLKTDISEQHNLAAYRHATVRHLTKQLERIKHAR